TAATNITSASSWAAGPAADETGNEAALTFRNRRDRPLVPDVGQPALPSCRYHGGVEGGECRKPALRVVRDAPGDAVGTRGIAVGCHVGNERGKAQCAIVEKFQVRLGGVERTFRERRDPEVEGALKLEPGDEPWILHATFRHRDDARER